MLQVNRRDKGADEKGNLSDKPEQPHQNNASSETAREINRDIILRAVRRHQPMSRADLARVTGLRPSTVSSIIARLIEDKWLLRGYRARSARGRRPTNIALNQNNVALAIDLRPEHANLATIDINGKIIKLVNIAFSASRGSKSEAQKAFRRILAAALNLKKESRSLVFHGVGVAVSGRVDPRTERLVFAPNSLWMHVDLRGEIQSVLGRRVEIDNAANACMISEKWFGGCADVPNLIAISVSEGIGTGLLVDGRLLRGEDGLAGEFGHMAFDESGPQCGCGNKGCWEMFASTRAGLRYYRELVPKSQLRNYRELIDLALAGDTAALLSIDKMIDALGKGLAILSVGLSPDAIIIVGECTALWSRICPILERHLAAKSIAAHTPRLIAAMEGDTARLRGAAAMIFQKVLFRSADWS